MPDTFDMPSTGTWEQLGGWVVNALARDIILPIENAAGFVGNMGGETSGFADLQEKRPTVPGSAGGRGWSQWTGPRRRAFEAWAANRGLDPDTHEANYGFLVAELRTPGWHNFVIKLRAASSLEDACRLTLTQYERPLDQSEAMLTKRVVWAKRALAGAKVLLSTSPVSSPVVPKPVLKGNPDIVFSWVQGMQHYLIDAGYLDGEADGIWGPKSQDAIARFQRGHKA